MEILICSGLSSSRPIWHKRDGDGSIRVQVEISNVCDGLFVEVK